MFLFVYTELIDDFYGLLADFVFGYDVIVETAYNSSLSGNCAPRWYFKRDFVRVVSSGGAVDAEAAESSSKS
jgi:hypothetical protein